MSDGVTTALVLFLLGALLLPQLMKSKTHYYIAFTCVLAIILVHTLMLMIGSEKFNVFGGVITGVLQMIALVCCVLGVGGMTLGELGGEMTGAYEVMRRGESEKTVIVPLTGAVPKKKDAAEPPTMREEIGNAPPAKPDTSSLPLE